MRGPYLSAPGGEVVERSEPGEVVSSRNRVPASSTGSGFALTDFSSIGGEVIGVRDPEMKVRQHLSAPGGEVGERSEPGEVVCAG